MITNRKMDAERKLVNAAFALSALSMIIAIYMLAEWLVN